MHLDTLLGIGYALFRNDPLRNQNAQNLQKIADAIDANAAREKKRQEMRVFLAERNLDTSDEVLARMGL